MNKCVDGSDNYNNNDQNNIVADNKLITIAQYSYNINTNRIIFNKSIIRNKYKNKIYRNRCRMHSAQVYR